MYCPNCGSQLEDQATFCSECGTRTNVAESAPAPQPTPSPAPVQQQVQAQPVPQPVQQAAPVSRPAPPPNQGYQQPQGVRPGTVDLNAPLGVFSYVGMFILMAIPLLNFIMMLMWIFGSQVNRNKKNFAIAVLVMAVISIVLSFVLGGAIAAILVPLMEDMEFYTY